MIAQHVAEGGVLGEVGSRSESPGDDTGSHTVSLAPEAHILNHIGIHEMASRYLL
jgi:hypothetical protein